MLVTSFTWHAWYQYLWTNRLRRRESFALSEVRPVGMECVFDITLCRGLIFLNTLQCQCHAFEHRFKMWINSVRKSFINTLSLTSPKNTASVCLCKRQKRQRQQIPYATSHQDDLLSVVFYASFEFSESIGDTSIQQRQLTCTLYSVQH